MAAAGMILFMAGAAGMDSDYRLIPVAMVLGGMALIWAAVRRKTI